MISRRGNNTSSQLKLILSASKSIEVDDLPLAVDKILSGFALILVPNAHTIFAVSLPGFARRTIEEAPTEREIKGPREGFNESLNDNISLIRRYIKDPNLRLEKKLIGERTKTEVAVIYLHDVANPDIVKEVHKRLEQIEIDGINAVFFDTGASRKVKMGVVAVVPGTQVPSNAGTIQQFLKRNIVVSGEGDSVVDAWTQVQANSERDIFFGQTRAVILSEKLARENLNDILEFIGRIPLVPPNTNVLVTKADPEKLLDLKNLNNEVPGNFIDFYFRSPFKRSLAIPVDLWRINAILDKKTGDPYIPVIEESQKNYKIAGTAVFSRGRFVAELSMDETQTLALIKGTEAGYQTIPMGKNKYAAFKNVRSKTRITPEKVPDGTPVFTVQSRIQGVLVENVPHREIHIREKKEIPIRAERLLKRKIQNLLAKLQSLNSDPIQFGDKFRIAHPRRWQKIDWHQIYPTAKFKVSIKFTLKETGLFR